jgi:hypothetical protein
MNAMMNRRRTVIELTFDCRLRTVDYIQSLTPNP